MLFRIVSLTILELNGVITMESIINAINFTQSISVLTELIWTTIIALITGLVYYQPQAQSNKYDETHIQL